MGILMANVLNILPLKLEESAFPIADKRSFGIWVTPTFCKSTMATQFSTLPGIMVSLIM
eukprot:CAMPEP_0205814590 /NCGR_PEP_ID=MMETSP0205-20121125/19841_1 /ASSEMBLY_ACC=CAM_ASM_000278 /TAXON_ID=36767 /ORGANISM="Euplotes focardii, Strain TN1" /LENGTH=58 /DNA_ID=CAMNT_0053099015 /DNA_START=140 /DNA_END=316 /DNA_ORIENTATION=+